jgi:UDP-N-acetylglucosamine 2-epimerase (non-hydrolysing)
MRLILVAGARPNFMKISPLIKSIMKFNKEPANRNRTIDYIFVHTGQHYDYEMSQIFFKDLSIPEPDIHLNIGSGTHAEQTGKIMIAFEKVLLTDTPDIVVVSGDVNSTLAAALSAAKLHIPVAHVESGIRSFNHNMPEEINRLLTDHISDYLFTTSVYDDKNLKKEGISADKIFRVGNIMVDCLNDYRNLAQKSSILGELGLNSKEYALLTLHRPDNVDDKDTLTGILETILEISSKIKIVFPVHPRTNNRLKEFKILNWLSKLERQLILTSPLSYLDLIKLELNSKFVITDSGGIQVETTALNIPCLTLLSSPVWLITHKQGTNVLTGINSKKIWTAVNRILSGKQKKTTRPELWDGKTADRIVQILSGTGQV